MFKSSTYTNRRHQLQRRLSVEKTSATGLILIPGHTESPMNYTANTFLFRQDSSFLYYFGWDMPALVGVIDVDENRTILFGDDLSLDDIVWMGPHPTMQEMAERVGITETASLNDLGRHLETAIQKGRPIHFLPPYRGETMQQLAGLLGIQPDKIANYASESLIRAVVAQRAHKSAEEVVEIEKAVDISYAMHTTAMRQTRPGRYEREVYGEVMGVSYALGQGPAFPIILSVHGETLHNHGHDNLMQAGDLLVHDSGGTSLMHYAGDITRTFPVSGTFSERQKAIYQIVLDAQMAAIEAIKPGIPFKDIHLLAAKIIVAGLKDLGLMKGAIEDAVEAGAHALFFPHGLGHMMGLDVHDLEALGEDYVGYDEEIQRSDQFGLAYLRLGRRLEPGFVVTVEPGIYFIPELIDQWQANGEHTAFINYEAVAGYRTFGGVRIEDDVLVTDDEKRVLGRPIPKTIADVEALCAGG